MTEKEIRESKNDIPELNDDLKNNIIKSYDAKVIAKKPAKFKPWHGLTIAGGCVATALIVTVVVTNPAINTAPYVKNETDASEYVVPGGEYDVPGEEYGDPSETRIAESTIEEGICYEIAGEGDYTRKTGYDDEWMPEGDSPERSSDAANKKMKAGQLTASALNDNDRFDSFKELVSNSQDGEGIFYNYYESFAFRTKNRVKVVTPANVTAKVELLNTNNEVVFASVPDKNGISYLFSKDYYENYTVSVKYLTVDDYEVLSAPAAETVDFTSQITNGIDNSKAVIELMVIIDTTGSMGDEIRYLQAELADVIDRVSHTTSAEVKLSILAYKDYCDVQQPGGYLTQFEDFSSNINQQQRFLNSLSAAGGGDFEEAVEKAFNEALKASWSEDTTKIALFVADAPAHDKDVTSWYNAITKLADRGVRVITLASSGITKKTEYFFRCQSMMTNGYYTYLTDHSGIGGSHLEATTDEPLEVEYVNSMLIRLINGYYTGTFAEPVNYLQDAQQ